MFGMSCSGLFLGGKYLITLSISSAYHLNYACHFSLIGQMHLEIHHFREGGCSSLLESKCLKYILMILRFSSILL